MSDGVFLYYQAAVNQRTGCVKEEKGENSPKNTRGLGTRYIIHARPAIGVGPTDLTTFEKSRGQGKDVAPHQPWH